jgi:hypothetical protein
VASQYPNGVAPEQYYQNPVTNVSRSFGCDSHDQVLMCP